MPLLSRYFFQGKFEVGGKFVPGYFQWKRAEVSQDSKQTCKSACSYCAFFLFSIKRACALSSAGLADTQALAGLDMSQTRFSRLNVFVSDVLSPSPHRDVPTTVCGS